jgi:hypothetical protein
MQKIIEGIKIVFSIAGIVLTIIGIIFLVLFLNKGDRKDIDKYTNKLNELLNRKKENDKKVNDSNIDDYNSDGTSKH